jgi:PleD family two-component response regulator
MDSSERACGFKARSLAVAQPRGSAAILAVEDEARVRELVGQVLKAHGHAVLEAKDGSEVPEIAARPEGTIHVILTKPGGATRSW